MKFLIDIFNLNKIRNSIPNSWCGLWTDRKGRQLIIKSTQHDFYSVTVLDANGMPYEIELLDGKSKKTIDLIARFTKDLKKTTILQVEAGMNGAGPTYNLYFLKVNRYDKPRWARKSDDVNDVIINPDVGMGLYDDWEDDLGVPWAFPLEYYKKSNRE